MKKTVITILLSVFLGVQLFAVSGTVYLVYTNGTVTYTDTETFYEFDVQAYVLSGASDPIFKYGQVYVEYNTTIFGGTNIVGSGNLTSVTLMGPLAVKTGGDIDLYNLSNSGADTFTDAFSIAFEPAYPDNPELYGAETQISTNSGAPSTIMHIKMEVAVSGTSTVSWPTNNIVLDQNTLYKDFSDGTDYAAFSSTNATETTAIVYSNTGDPALPITLSEFSAQYEDAKVVLAWTTESEVQNLGYVVKRAIRYSDDDVSPYDVVGSYQTDENLLGAGTTTEQNSYVYYDTDVKPGVNYSYILVDVDYNGNTVEHDPVSILIPENLLYANEDFELGSNYPNPFNPSFTIPFELKKTMDVSINMYDITGKQVMTIVDGSFTARQYQYRVNASDLNSGIYFVRTVIGNEVFTQKMTLLK
jgi:type IX secretion system substrate protein